MERNIERTERIYKAMLSKGYQGEFHTLTLFSTTGKDFVKAFMVLTLIFLLLGVDMAGVFNIAERGWY